MLSLKLILFVYAWLSAGADSRLNPCNEASHGQTVAHGIPPVAGSRLAEALAYCRRTGHDTLIACFVDMSLHSGKKRFFVYDLQERKLLLSGLCCHGMGKGSTCSRPVYSNEAGSNCTSPGRYRIGAKAYSAWGIHVHYKLHGLDRSNSNAFRRLVVLHSHDPVPEEEIYPEHLPMGWSLGCPVVSNGFLQELGRLLQKAGRPVLLWIYG